MENLKNVKEQAQEICYKRHEIIEVLKTLNNIVVSLDRISACSIDFDEAECNQILDDYIKDWSVLRKLADARSVLSEPFSRLLEEDDMSEIEREMQDVQYWRLSRRKPEK